MSQRQSHDLTVSLQAVTSAQSGLDRARTQNVLRGAASWEQRRLLAALEVYADALTSHGHPMPYRMRSELDMYRAMFNSVRRHIR